MFVVHKNRNINPQMDFLNYQVFVQMFKKAVRQAENNFSLPYSFLYIPDYLRIP